VLEGDGIATEVVEIDGRGSCVARLAAGSASSEPPLILLSHLDVVPVDAEAWSRDPFGGELLDGVIWGRGAVDMKHMVAMELGVMLELRRRGVELRRDVIFAAVADEEAGGTHGAQALVDRRPDLFRSESGFAAAALNEVGGFSMTLDGRRYYAIQVAEKGIIWTRLRTTGTPGHGSMPHPDNAAIKLARAVARIAGEDHPARLIPVVERFFATLGLSDVAHLAESDPGAASAALTAAVSDPVLRHALDAMLRDTVTPNVLRAGKKVNVMPGSGEAEIDVRTLPGTDRGALLAHLQELVGDDGVVEAVISLPAVEWPESAEIVSLMREALASADPEAVAAPMMITPGTDAKALSRLGIPCYGFAPLRLDPEIPFLALFHGHDERVPVSAIEFGLPVLYEVVERYTAQR
nr:M20/M25/M40 family metallo-hydrolase [Chloroflexota bacterium]